MHNAGALFPSSISVFGRPSLRHAMSSRSMIADFSGMLSILLRSARNRFVRSAPECGCSVLDVHLGAVAVEFGLVQPLRSDRGPSGERGQQRGEERDFAQHRA